MISDREALIRKFLKDVGMKNAIREPLQGDASARSYERLTLNKTQAILMNAPQDEVIDAADLSLSSEERSRLGYNAKARIAGLNTTAFAAITQELHCRGFSVPDILAADLENGLILLEDLGGDLFARVIETDPHAERPLYEGAVDTLAAIYRSSFAHEFTYNDYFWRVHDYDETAFLAEMDLCLDWYAPDQGFEISRDQRAEFYDLWRAAFTHLNVHASGLALRDFHAENLFWLPDRQATSRIGLIDYQDALFVHPAYDVTSLLEDIRRDVDPDLFEPLKQRFCEKAGIAYGPEFQAAYAVLSAQRATKLLGFPVRADVKFGKPQYRGLLPRVKGHLQRNLEHTALTDIRAWYEKYMPEVLL